MPCGQQVSADLARGEQQLVKLQMVVAQAARDGRASGKIFVDERTHHVALKALLMVDHVIRNAQVLGHAAGVVHVIDRAAAALHLLGHAFASGQAALVPELHGQAHHVVAFGAQHGRNGGRIHTAGHCYGYGLRGHKWLYSIIDGSRKRCLREARMRELREDAADARHLIVGDL